MYPENPGLQKTTGFTSTMLLNPEVCDVELFPAETRPPQTSEKNKNTEISHVPKQQLFGSYMSISCKLLIGNKLIGKQDFRVFKLLFFLSCVSHSSCDPYI